MTNFIKGFSKNCLQFLSQTNYVEISDFDKIQIISKIKILKLTTLNLRFLKFLIIGNPLKSMQALDILVNRLGGFLAGAHGEDDRGGTAHGIATGEYART